ncbi:glycosyltransferase family 2 protein [Paenibacillus humicola]|uniref:glycosyltransferase family 2 protein n=1 Tax=Paenibacillus humicola TaxID=3110540 RepID=UPI00237AB5AF|nr:glycosyltransferase [Paenibacillus humicola]
MAIRRSAAPARAPGISVVTCTNKPAFLHMLLSNYGRQTYRKKELIIVVNNDRARLSRYRRMAARYPNVRVYRLPAGRTLGACLNYASALARYAYIAKMDDDEYYAPRYLYDMMRSFGRSGADVVGKRAYFIYLKGSRLLIQRFSAQNRFVSILAGGTLVYKKHVWRRVKFTNRSLGEDVLFCRGCRRKGFRLYAGDRYNFCALRRERHDSHTWKNSDRAFLAHPQTRIIARGANYKPYVVRS